MTIPDTDLLGDVPTRPRAVTEAEWLDRCATFYVENGGISRDDALACAEGCWEDAMRTHGDSATVVVCVDPEGAAEADMDSWGDHDDDE